MIPSVFHFTCMGLKLLFFESNDLLGSCFSHKKLILLINEVVETISY